MSELTNMAAFQQKVNADKAVSLVGIRMSLMLVWPCCRWSNILDMISIAPRQPEYLISTCLVNTSALMEEKQKFVTGFISNASRTNPLPALFILA